jgi:DNA-binding response OmpR family regulator
MAWETILIVDDDAIFGQLLTSYLQERQFETALARDAMQATMAIRRATPSAILLDIILPGGTGLDVLKRLRAGSGLQPIVIAMSASSDPSLPDKAAGLGAQAFLQKPFNLDEMYALLCRLLGRPDTLSE